MTEDISTGTICPYPFTFAKNSSNDLLSCTLTYGEALDPGLFIQQVAFGMSYGVVALPVLLRRLYLTVANDLQNGKLWYESSQSKLYVAAIVMSISVAVEMIDPYGMRTILHPYLYFMADGHFAASLLLMAFFGADFYVTTAKRANFQDGLSTKFVIVVLLLCFLNYIVLQFVAFMIPRYYEVFEATKFLGASLLVAVFIIFQVLARASILEVLQQGGVEGDSFRGAAICCCAEPEIHSVQQRRILTVKRKFAESFGIMSIGFVTSLAFGLLKIGLLNGDTDYQWERKLEDQPGFSFTMYRLVGLVGIIVIVRTFNLPKRGRNSSNKKCSGQIVISKESQAV